MIEKLFTSKIRVKLLEYFIFRKQKSKVRETSRNTGINVSAVSMELSNLTALSILKKEEVFVQEIRTYILKIRIIEGGKDGKYKVIVWYKILIYWIQMCMGRF